MKINILLDILGNYINTQDTDYSILVHGEWGNGKTYFFRNSFSKHLEKINKEVSCIYISLYGFSTIEALKREIFIELKIPSLKSKSGSKLAGVGKVLFKGAANITGMKNILDNQEIETYIEFNDKTTLLVFDDLERTDNEFQNVFLGYVSHLCENNGLKVIIIANENEIQNTSYNQIKEKTIRYSYPFNLSISEIFDSSKLTGVHTEVVSSLNIVQNIFKITEYSNLRTYKFIIDISNRLVSKLKKSFSKSDELENIIVLIIKIVSVISIEFKSTKDKELFIKELKYLFENYSQYLKETKEKNHFFQKYKHLFTEIKTLPKSIINYIISGEFDENEIVKDFKKLENRLSYINNPIGKLITQLKNYDELNENELNTLIYKITDKISEGNIQIDDILDSFGLILHLVDKYDNLYLDKENLLQKYETGIEAIAKQDFELNRSHSSYQQNEDQNIQFKNKLIDKINERNRHITKEFFIEKSQEVLKLFSQYEKDSTIKIDPNLLFHNDGKDIFNIYLKFSNKNKKKLNNYLSRYYIPNLQFTHPSFDIFLSEVKKYLETNTSITIEREHFERIQKILNDFSKTNNIWSL